LSSPSSSRRADAESSSTSIRIRVT
jgi:hypothetical protein